MNSSSEPPDDAPGPPTLHEEWQVVLADRSSSKVVLHNPLSSRFSIVPYYAVRSTSTLPRMNATPRESARGEDDKNDSPLPATSTSSSSTATPPVTQTICPLCFQPVPRPAGRGPSPLRHPLLPLPPSSSSTFDDGTSEQSDGDEDARWTGRRRRKRWTGASGTGTYFQLLSEANSRVNSPTTTGGTAARGIEGRGSAREDPALSEGQMNEGYCEKFFTEVQLLGRGGQGVVYLVRHVLNGEGLGLYALKKIRVGDSTLSLLQILREVHLLESISHPNVINYHHAWLQSSPPSTFAPPVPTLHVLMAFANGGSLQDFVSQRGGGGSEGQDGMEMNTGERRKARHRTSRARGGANERAVHLLKVEDALDLFEDVVVGLAFLHARNILHLDLKAENVLLHWDEDALLPTCKLSDFGNATNDSYHRERHGGSGTLAYTPPEALFPPDPRTGKFPSPDRATDQWALGLILHLLCFFALPWREAGEEGDTLELEREIREYRGFFPSDAIPCSPLPFPSSSSPALSHPPPLFTARHDLPPSLLLLLSSLIHLSPTTPHSPLPPRFFPIPHSSTSTLPPSRTSSFTVFLAPLVIALAKAILLSSPSHSSSLPIWLALLILLETALDVALSSLRVTVGLVVIHAAVLRTVRMAGGA
ncbi:hypothetical protein JCM8547_000242 [Rhodosporidiobolus lusitaniae]